MGLYTTCVHKKLYFGINLGFKISNTSITYIPLGDATRQNYLIITLSCVPNILK